MGREKKGCMMTCCGSGLVVLLLGVGWWNIANNLPEINIPSPKMPSPNAFDFFVKASKQIENENQVGLALDGKSTVATDESRKTQAELLADNAEALKTLREGLPLAYMPPPVRSIGARFTYFAGFRSLARLLMLESQVKATHKDWNGAVNSKMDALQLGVETAHGSPIIGSLVGIACQAIGRRDVWKDFDHLNAAQAKTATQRLQKILALQTPWAETLQEEKWMGQASLRDVLNGKAVEGMSSSFMMKVAGIFYRKGRIMDNYTLYMDQTIVNGKLPYAAHPPLPHMPNDPISQVMFLVFEQAHFKAIETETQNALLLTALALHAYRLEKGHYPHTLQELVPTYLQKIPNDPFALKGPLQYKLQGKTYLLYSVGPDGKDDGGKMIDDPSAMPLNPGLRYRAQEKSVGDIVAGKNY